MTFAKKRLFPLLLVCILMLNALPLANAASSSDAGKKGTVNATELRVRDSRSTTGKVLYSLKKGDSVTIVDYKSEWYKIKVSGKSGYGYVLAEYIKTSSSSSSSSYDTLKKGSKGADVKRLQQRLKDLKYFYTSVTGTFGDATEDAVKAFQKAAKLSSDGVAGPTTQEKLYASSAPAAAATPKPVVTPKPSTTPTPTNIDYDEDDTELTDVASGPTPPPADGSNPVPEIGKVELNNWWTDKGGDIQKAIPRGATMIVTDIKTGITFTEKRLGGTNHADVEPATAFDTAQLFKIYGSKWQWTRRAVLVTVGDRTFAGSMNGFPHGGASISSNNFAGHHCIHFYQSRTHGSNSLDKDHQAMVQAAYKYGQENYGEDDFDNPNETETETEVVEVPNTEVPESPLANEDTTLE